ncbi:MAG: tyrosine recombinase XerD [Actinobacteria bacterium]|nr:tyrosine recombinase XerD [Actinomycetota bacterium]
MPGDERDVVAGGDAFTLPYSAEDFLTWLVAERGRSANTISAYRRDLMAYGRWLVADRSATTMDGASRDDIVAFIGHLRAGRGLAPSSVKRQLVAVRSFYRFREQEGYADHDPAADIEVPPVPAGLPKALSERDVQSLIDAVTGDDPVARRDRAMVEVLYGTGARISEVVGLSLGDVDLDAQLLRLFGKGSKERVVPVGRYAMRALLDWLGEGGRPAVVPRQWARRGDAEAVFLNQRGGRLSRQGAYGIICEYGRRVGLGAKLSPHVLRHSCATHMLDHGADIRSVQELLGHASITTTQVYTLVSTERLWSVYDAAHPRARLT